MCAEGVRGVKRPLPRTRILSVHARCAAPRLRNAAVWGVPPRARSGSAQPAQPLKPTRPGVGGCLDIGPPVGLDSRGMNPGSATYPCTAIWTECGEEEFAGELSVETQGLMFSSDSGTVGFPFARVQIDRLDDGRISFSDPEQPEWMVFMPSDAILREFVFRQRNDLRVQVRDLRRRLEGRRRLQLTGWFLGIFAAISLLVWMTTPLVVSFVVGRISVERENELAEEVLAKLGKKLEGAQDPGQMAQLDFLADRIARGLPKHPYTFRFRLLAWPEPNALALPGGTILVTTGLVAAAASPEEIAGVLAHEMAHVLRRHGLRQLVVSLGPYYAMRVFISDRDSFAALLGGVSHLLLRQGFSRDYEREADRKGWSYLMAAGIDPRGLSTLLARTGNDAAGGPRDFRVRDVPEGLRSHPENAERLQYLEELWRKSARRSGFVDLRAEGSPFAPGAPDGSGR